MRIIKITSSGHFTQVPNSTLRNGTLSLRALGLLTYLLSLPESWRFRAEDLAKERPEGRDAIRKAMQELEALGYAKWVKRQNERGQWSKDLYVSDAPRLNEIDSPKPENPSFGGSGLIQKNVKGGASGAPQTDGLKVADDLARAMIDERNLTGSAISIEWSTRLLGCLVRRSDLSWGLDDDVSVSDARLVYEEWRNAREEFVRAALRDQAAVEPDR